MGAYDPVEKLIVDNIIATLRTVTKGPDYFHTFDNVRGVQTADPSSFPAVEVEAGTDTVIATDSGGACDYIKRMLDVTVYVWVRRDSGADVQSWLQRATMDVMNVMAMDDERGGNASDCNYAGSTKAIDEGGMGRVEVRFRVLYLTKRSASETRV